MLEGSVAGGDTREMYLAKENLHFMLCIALKLIEQPWTK